ncbi:AtpZ/AtpI family protein [Paenibacillus sp. GSMTC-2017]|uniref:AtpZ/AtpI family protein n=1 Tax=Paenibacillus sp. GSMTC-2017 TaxID=2794350 RepID=UPI0018D913CD|nr:AtpZ/AtpI family protein [Paenibacillus sp. GSMTC-2017]MBH5316331.1 AtpZ/AtpI family protein [Paenibacillus sp. GSMTC-2017]
MHIISAILHYLTHHPLWSFLIILFISLFIGILITIWRNHGKWLIVFPILGFITAIFNIFFTHYLNSLFLNAVGTEGTAIIVYAEQTNSTYNDKYIWEYSVVLKTSEGQDVATSFNTMSASIYPLRNAILIPPQGEVFVAKYVPGFERNILIMSDKSNYGKKWVINKDLKPVLKAEAQLATSPSNPDFISEYRLALEAFIEKYRDGPDPALIQQFEQKLEALEK